MAAKEPGRETSGDGTSAFMARQSPTPEEAPESTLTLSPPSDMRLPAVGHGCDACRRLEKMVLSHDR